VELLKLKSKTKSKAKYIENTNSSIQKKIINFDLPETPTAQQLNI
jgi:hypothetical protein